MKKLGLLACLLIICSYLLVGTSFGRYLISNVFNVGLTADTSVKCVTLLDVNKDTEDHYQPLESIIEDDKLVFLVANGLEDNYSTVDQLVKVSCFVSIGYGEIYDEENNIDLLNLSLTINNITYQGKAITIEEDTTLYQQYGAGYLYKFYNSSNEELELTLIGGSFNYERVTLNVIGKAKEICYLKVMLNGRDK